MCALRSAINCYAVYDDDADDGGRDRDERTLFMLHAKNPWTKECGERKQSVCCGSIGVPRHRKARISGA